MACRGGLRRDRPAQATGDPASPGRRRAERRRDRVALRGQPARDLAAPEGAPRRRPRRGAPRGAAAALPRPARRARGPARLPRRDHARRPAAAEARGRGRAAEWPRRAQLASSSTRSRSRPIRRSCSRTSPPRSSWSVGWAPTRPSTPGRGGVFRVVFHPTADVAAFISASGGATGEVVTNAVLGEFLTVDPYERIAFTWGYENELFAMPPQSAAVEVSLTPAGGTTVVRLVHRRLPEA